MTGCDPLRRSRLKQLSHDSDRSTRQRWRPSRVDDSMPAGRSVA
jgi:hypothetical protein